eukprot:g10329.t1
MLQSEDLPKNMKPQTVLRALQDDFSSIAEARKLLVKKVPACDSMSDWMLREFVWVCENDIEAQTERQDQEATEFEDAGMAANEAARGVVEKPIMPRSNWAVKAFWSIALITVSAALINYNKYLMSPSRFPYPMVLVSLHMSCGSLLSCGLYMVAVDATFLWSRVLPVGLAFATSLICSNVAYEYASVPFLQMVKQSNVIIVFFLSLLAGLEQFRSNLALVLLCIVVATAFTVNGELRFSLTGLLAQLCGNFAESCRVVMQGILLTGAERLDPLSFVAVVSPICGLFMARHLQHSERQSGPSMSRHSQVINTAAPDM